MISKCKKKLFKLFVKDKEIGKNKKCKNFGLQALKALRYLNK